MAAFAGSVRCWVDAIHNGADALTAVLVEIAFVLGQWAVNRCCTDWWRAPRRVNPRLMDSAEKPGLTRAALRAYK